MLCCQADPLVERAPLIWNEMLGHSRLAVCLPEPLGRVRCLVQDRPPFGTDVHPSGPVPRLLPVGPPAVAARTHGYAAGAKLLLKFT